MSSGTQNDMDWAGAGVPQTGAAAPETSAGTYPSDEEILGIDPPSPNNGHGGRARGADALGGAETGKPQQAEINKSEDSSRNTQAANRDTEDLRAFREMFPGGADEARTLRQAAQNLDSMREAANSVDRIDAAIFSGDAKAQAEVVAELARANPAAFRQLFAEAEKVLATLAANGPQTGQGAVQPQLNAQPQAQQASPQAPPQMPQFDPAEYAAFERATNDAVARDVRATITDTLARVLPEGVAEGAARRIGDDIFNEIHRTLASDQALSAQVGDVLSGRRFGTAEQQRVASLLAGRARQIAPAVARRVIGEWTSSVLSTARTRAARQAAASARVDIAAPGGSLDSMPMRPMSPREIDYARMSDDEILSL
jgi:hypothetical protein